MPTRPPQDSTSARYFAPPLGEVSRPSVKAWTIAPGAISTSAFRWRSLECTPPSLTSPIRCTRGASFSAACSTSFSRQRPVLDRLVDAGEVLRDDRARAEVEVPDLGVAHLALGQPDALAHRDQLRVRLGVPQLVEHRRVGERHRVARPVGREPPAVEHDQDDVGDAHARAASTIAANESACSEAPPTSAPSMSSCDEDLGRVLGLQRAAVEDADRRCRPPCRSPAPARARTRTRPARSRASRSGRCRSPRSARRPRRPRAAARPAPSRGLPGPGGGACARCRRARAPPRTRRRRGSGSAPPPAPAGPSAGARGRSRRSTGGARSGRGSRPGRRSRTSIGAVISPVYAPLSFSCMFCA